MLIEVSVKDLCRIVAGLSMYEEAIRKGEVPSSVTDLATDMGDDPPTAKDLNRLISRIDSNPAAHR